MHKDWKEFDTALEKARKRFAGFIFEMPWNRELRTEVESFLIMFDQAQARLIPKGKSEYLCLGCQKILQSEEVTQRGTHSLKHSNCGAKVLEIE